MWYALAANSGRAEARTRMGDAAALGQLGQRRDIASAVRWYRLAADADPVAAYRLGVLAETGDGMAKDPAEALKWFRAAAAQYQPDALLRLAEAARDGSLGVPKDPAEAERLFKSAADHGQPTALLTLGAMREGAGGDDVSAQRSWREAADRGVPEACDRLGRAYRDGELGLAVDDAEARHWFQRAADLGDADGALNLGAMLMVGRGGPADEAGAMALYRRAADLGSATAEANIAGVYWVGTETTPKDRQEAVRHYRIAAKGGNVVAARMLSVAYGTGDGAERDEIRQLAWARVAAERGRGVAEHRRLSDPDRRRRHLRLRGGRDVADAGGGSLGAGELHDLATENLHTAAAQLNADEQAEVARRVAKWKEANGG